MNIVSRGIRNAFRNVTRTVSIAVILGLSIGLSLTMLIAHQTVNQKIESVKASVGNTIVISPAGFNGGSQVNNSLTTSDLAKVSKISHVSSITETLTDRLTTIGSTQPSFGFGGQSSSDSASKQTSLTSPVTINANSGNGGGRRFFVSGGSGSSVPTNFTPPVSFIGTNDSSKVDSTTITVKSGGSTLTDSSDDYKALISSGMASKNSLKVGSTFTAYDQTITVAGIFDTSNQAQSGTVVLTLPALQKLTGQTGAITSATAYVDQLDNLSSATSAVKSALGSNADVTSSQEEADQAVAPLNNVKSISLYSLIGAVIAGAIIILLTMVMIVRERRREIGVVKAIGASNLSVMFQFMVEAVTLTVISAVIGIALGVVAANPITKQLVSSSSSSSSSDAGSGGAPGQGGTGDREGRTQRFRTGGRGVGAVRDNITNIEAAVGWTIILDGLGAALVIALLGSSMASFFIAKIRPAEVLRAE